MKPVKNKAYLIGELDSSTHTKQYQQFKHDF